MSLGESLIKAGLINSADVDRALDRQTHEGGTLGKALIDLGVLTAEQLDAYFRAPPPTLFTIADTGLRPELLSGLVLKFMHRYGTETPAAIAPQIKLPPPLVALVVRGLHERGLAETLGGAIVASGVENRFILTGRGREAALEAMAQSEYIGPAPVTLEAYNAQIDRQRITNDRIDAQMLTEALGRDLVLPEGLIDRIGPAVNAGRAMMFYGAPGDGKSSISQGIAHSYKQPAHVPYAIEVDGYVIKVFDPATHTEFVEDTAAGNGAAAPVRHLKLGGEDRRWIKCRRPRSVVGGELTLDMLDIGYNSDGKYYEAPVHIKANSGIFIIEDFGRQIDTPQKLMNRWVLPLETQRDYLTLASGRKFSINFDCLVIVSTNIPPKKIMDEAMLRRFRYKFHITPPTREDYREIMVRAARQFGLEATDALIELLYSRVYDAGTLAPSRFHPRFILDHVVARCRFAGHAPTLNPDLVLEATTHIGTDE